MSDGVAAGGLEVLLVDDEPDLRVALADALRQASHRVAVASDGAEADALLAARAFDVLLCDVRLPKMDGLTRFRRARQRSPSTDVILMTAYAEVADAVAALKEGAFDYLSKPFELD